MDYFSREYIWTNHWFSGGHSFVFRGVKKPTENQRLCRGWKGAGKDQSKDHSKGPKGKNGTKGGFKADSAGERIWRRKRRKETTGRLICYWRICQIELQIEMNRVQVVLLNDLFMSTKAWPAIRSWFKAGPFFLGFQGEGSTCGQLPLFLFICWGWLNYFSHIGIKKYKCCWHFWVKNAQRASKVFIWIV